MKTHSSRVPPAWLVLVGSLLWPNLDLNAQNAGETPAPPASAKPAAYASAWGREQPRPELAAFQSWAGRYQAAASPAARAGLVAEGVGLAKQRRALLADLIERDPEMALAAAVPAPVRDQLPGEILAELEPRVSGIGDFSVLGVLRATNGPAVEPIQRLVRLNGRTYRAWVYGRRLGQTTKFGIPLHGVAIDGVMAVHEDALRELEADETATPARPMVDLRSTAQQATNLPLILGQMGDQLYRFASREQLRRVEARLEAAETGLGPHPLRTATAIMEDSDDSGASGEAQPLDLTTPWTGGGKNVLVIRVDFPDLTNFPYSAATIQNLSDTQISPFYLKSSFQLTSVTNTVTALVYRLPQAAAYYATNGADYQLHSDAQTAAAANYTLTNYDRIIVVFANLSGISGSKITYGGMAQVGGPDIWCNGEYDFRVIAHELGHTYGLWHGNLWQVSDGNPISPSGSSVEYGDDFDTMGANYANSQQTDFNPWFKSTLGWIDSTQLVTVTTSGTYRVYAFDHDNYLAARGETLGLKIFKDSTHNYWIGCRRNFTGNASMTNGVYIIWGYNYNRANDLLDMTTPGSSDQDAALATGASFTDAAAAITVNPLAAGGVAPNEYRDVQIVFGLLAPVITSPPASQTAWLETTAVFPIQARGNPAPAFRWQRKANGSPAWSVLSDAGSYSGSGTSNLAVNVTELAMNGDQFRCLVTNSTGSVTSSPAATLTVNSGLVISTLAGQATNGGSADGTGTNAQFYYPINLATDARRNVYVADYGNGSIRKLTPDGVVSTIVQGFYGLEGVAVDVVSNVYFVDTSDHVIQRVTPGGSVTVLAGTLGVPGSADGTNGDARFNYPWGIAVDSATNLYVTDSANSTIRRITPRGGNWVVTTLAGLAGGTGTTDGTNANARFNNPGGLALDASGNIYVADSLNNSIRKITPDATGTNWIVTTLASQTGVSGSGDGYGSNDKLTVPLRWPSGVAVDGTGNVYVADTGNDLIREITPQRSTITLAGRDFTAGSADGYCTNAQFNSPYGVAVDDAGNVYVADTQNHTIRVGRFASVLVPRLAVSLSNHVATLTWPVPIQTFSLQSATNLPATNWVPAGARPVVLNGQNYVTNPASGGNRFFRLIHP
ncbi:MAG TPA: hypothetical protein VMB80_16100 [Candidatus Acidoferrum sp.]|nr:hypothetical protein [Candidatus Acidoferrum sp.]